MPKKVKIEILDKEYNLEPKSSLKEITNNRGTIKKEEIPKPTKIR
tara:strand:- start:125 stop:259 length:135 start_codon:yes stop_codon:yes gene_type:complete